MCETQALTRTRSRSPLCSLFQLYVCTHDVLHLYRTTDKFIAIKAVLGIAVLQARQLSLAALATRCGCVPRTLRHCLPRSL
jgi:hypothetical protein